MTLKTPPRLLGKKPHHFRYVDKDYFMFKVNYLGINSVRQYHKWRKDCKPAGFPRHPERTYATTWAKLLQTDNKYLAHEKYAVSAAALLKYWEATNLVQPLGLESKQDYLDAFDRGDIPEGIPRQPNARYTLFTKNGGWSGFLGKKAIDKVKAASKVEPLFILYRTSGQSPNVLSIVIHKKGVSSMVKMIREQGIDVVKIYRWYPEFGEYVFDILDAFGTKQGESSWMFSNVHEVLFELGSVLEVFKP